MMAELEDARNQYIERMVAARRRGNRGEAKYYARHAVQVEMYLEGWGK